MRSLHILCHADVGAVRAVSGTESVVDKHVRDRSEILAECVDVLCLFRAETCIFKKNHVAVLHRGHGGSGIVADHCAVSGELHFLSEQLGEALCDRSEGELLFRTVLRLAEMAAQNDLAAVSDELLDRGKRGDETVLVRDLSVLKRHVEVAAAKYALALDIDIIYRFLVESHILIPPLFFSLKRGSGPKRPDPRGHYMKADHAPRSLPKCLIVRTIWLV